MGTLLTTVAAMVIGGGLAVATVVGVVHSQTQGPDRSPTNVDAPIVQYGSN